MVTAMEQADLFRTWVLILVVGFLIIAVRKGALKRLSKGLPAPRAPREIDLAREVQRIRKILFSIFLLIVSLGIFIMAAWPRGFIITPITP